MLEFKSAIHVFFVPWIASLIAALASHLLALQAQANYELQLRVDMNEERQLTSRWLRMCAVVQTIFATSAAAWSEPIAPVAGNHPGNAVTKGAISPSFPRPTQNVRMEIATLLERQETFRRYDDNGAPKLVNARIAGPTQLPQLSPPQPVYCIHVDLIMTNRFLLTTHDQLLAVVRFPPSENGKQRIEGQVRSLSTAPSASATCNNVPYTPFPELEQLRAQRRRALGKADS
jgi:hypothetical protein